MPNARKNRTQRKQKHRSGGGYLQDQQWFGDYMPPTSYGAPLSTAATPDAIRPVLLATRGGSRKMNRKNLKRGGFVPSIMGPFAANAQAAIVPAALYMVYHTMVPKKLSASVGGLFNSRKAKKSRKNRK
jgi:hypothetical protein